MGNTPVLSPLWKIIRIHTKYYALDHSMTYQCYLHEKHMFWLFCSDSFDGLSISGHGKSYPGKIVTIWYENGQNSKNLSKSNFRICPWSTFWARYWVTGLVGGLGCINKSFGTQWSAQYGHKGLYPVCTGHICCIRLILGPERGYLNPLVQENHYKYDQSGWSYKYLETHVFRCAKKKNPKKSFFIIFMGSNLVKMPAQTQLAVANISNIPIALKLQRDKGQ